MQNIDKIILAELLVDNCVHGDTIRALYSATSGHARTCMRLRCLQYSKFTHLCMHLLVVFLIMNYQLMVMNRLKFIWNISGIFGEIVLGFKQCQYRSSLLEQAQGLH